MGKITAGIRRNAWSYLFVLPMFALFLAFTLYPLAASFHYTFYEWDGIGKPSDFVGLKHYVSIASDALFWNAFRNTFFYTIVGVPIQLLLALALAVILNTYWLRGRYVFRYAFISPIVTSSAVIGIVFTLIYSSLGQHFNRLLMQLGFIERPLDWLGNPQIAMWLIVLVGVWVGLGYPLIYFLAALQSIDRELYDAATVDGASGFLCFWYITIPLIRPVGVVVLLMTALHSLRVFDIVQVMTQGGPFFATDVVGTYIYRMAFFVMPSGDVASRLGYASAAAFFMGLLVMGISLLQIAAVRRMTRISRNESHHDQA